MRAAIDTLAVDQGQIGTQSQGAKLHCMLAVPSWGRQADNFLMDEPLSSLDAKLRVTMRGELRRFHMAPRRAV
jgi:ABC-type Fe3+/spermidine/putrescine transport system ATPase subunit